MRDAGHRPAAWCVANSRGGGRVGRRRCRTSVAGGERGRARDPFAVRSGWAPADGLLVMVPLIHGVRSAGGARGWGSPSRGPGPSASCCWRRARDAFLAVEVAAGERTREELLHETQALNRRLEWQEEELRTTNESSRRSMRSCTQTNEEAARQTSAAREAERKQKARGAERKHRARGHARPGFEQQTQERHGSARTSRRSSTTCRTRLRTPLNSLALLSGRLAENERATLSRKQVEFARDGERRGKKRSARTINRCSIWQKVEAGKAGAQGRDVAAARTSPSGPSEF